MSNKPTGGLLTARPGMGAGRPGLPLSSLIASRLTALADVSSARRANGDRGGASSGSGMTTTRRSSCRLATQSMFRRRRKYARAHIFSSNGKIERQCLFVVRTQQPTTQRTTTVQTNLSRTRRRWSRDAAGRLRRKTCPPSESWIGGGELEHPCYSLLSG